jgi:hypothetical protein
MYWSNQTRHGDNRYEWQKLQTQGKEMNEVKIHKAALRIAKGLRTIVNETFYMSAATDEEIMFACMDVLLEIYQRFDAKVPNGTYLPPRR